MLLLWTNFGLIVIIKILLANKIGSMLDSITLYGSMTSGHVKL